MYLSKIKLQKPGVVKRILDKSTSFEGVILEQIGLEYKVQYVTDEDAKLSDFFLISQVIRKIKKDWKR